jgi:hypothetical protein
LPRYTLTKLTTSFWTHPNTQLALV